MKKIILVFITTIIFICSSIANYSKSINTGLANNMIRLHVVANSNSKNDQLLKLKVRDRILEYTNTLLKDSKNIDETKYIISQNLDNIATVARDYMKENNINYLEIYSKDINIAINEFETFLNNYYKNKKMI